MRFVVFVGIDWGMSKLAHALAMPFLILAALLVLAGGLIAIPVMLCMPEAQDA